MIVREKYFKNILEVRRVSDRLTSVRMEIEEVMLNVVSAYAPQVGCDTEEKKQFWGEMEEMMESIPRDERVIIGADINGHIGSGNMGDERVMETHGLGDRNTETECAQQRADCYKYSRTAIEINCIRTPEANIVYSTTLKTIQIVVCCRFLSYSVMLRLTQRR